MRINCLLARFACLSLWCDVLVTCRNTDGFRIGCISAVGPKSQEGLSHPCPTIWNHASPLRASWGLPVFTAAVVSLTDMTKNTANPATWEWEWEIYEHDLQGSCHTSRPDDRCNEQIPWFSLPLLGLESPYAEVLMPL